ncbi:MAG: hypothetical protein OXS35_04480, partial [Dehalococcoidia bacterium]|nr:hypothetical protein [Dehalococcoidia bacterium]
MKNITLSADGDLMDEARRHASSKNTTLNAEFRLWLEDYVGHKRSTGSVRAGWRLRPRRSGTGCRSAGRCSTTW